MVGHQSNTSPGNPTSPSGVHAGKALQVDTTSAPGDRTARTPIVARGSSVRPRRSPRRSDTRSLRMGITSAATGSWSALWLAAFGKDITFGGALKWSGALGSSSLATKVSTTAFHKMGVSPSSPSSASSSSFPHLASRIHLNMQATRQSMPFHSFTTLHECYVICGLIEEFPSTSQQPLF